MRVSVFFLFIACCSSPNPSGDVGTDVDPPVFQERTFGSLGSSDIEFFCDHVDRSACESFPEIAISECVLLIERISEKEPNRPVQTMFDCWSADSCNLYSGLCSPDCFLFSVAECDVRGCQVYSGLIYDSDNMCASERTPIYCLNTKRNCTNVLETIESPDGEIFVLLQFCGAPDGWRLIEGDEVLCE